MDSWDTANLVLGCFCIVLSFLPTGYLISNNRYKRKLYLYSLLIYSGRAKLTFKCREFAATPSRKR